MPEANDEDPRSIDELFAAATDWSRNEGEGDWSAVFALQRIGSREVLDKTLLLLQSADPRSRAQAVTVLGQFGGSGQSYRDERIAAINPLIAPDTDAHVLYSAVAAMSHLKDLHGIQRVIEVADYPDEHVRQAVAFALGGRTEPESVATLIRLTSDESAFVRDWATFGIGQLNSLDTPEIREALYCRIDDVDKDTRYEALCGLARCGDLRVVAPLVEAIKKNEQDFSLWLPAATLLNIDLEEEDTTLLDADLEKAEEAADYWIVRLQSLIR